MAWNSASVLARASAGLPVVLLVFIGRGTPAFSSSSANFSFDARSDSSTSAAHSRLNSLFSSSLWAFFSMGASSASSGSVNIFSVMEMSRSSDFGYGAPMVPSGRIPMSRREKISSHRYTSWAQYAASSASISGVSSSSPSVLCTAWPLGGNP